MATSAGTAWLSYYSDRDRVISPASARLDDLRCGAANFLIPSGGVAEFGELIAA
jgi:hypothetical protein